MILLAFFLQATAPQPIDMTPLYDEEQAARVWEAHLYCLTQGGFERRTQTRDPGQIAADVIRLCEPRAAALRVALADVYRRKSQLMSAGEQPDQAAANYVSEMNGRIEPVIRMERERRNAQNR